MSTGRVEGPDDPQKSQGAAESSGRASTGISFGGLLRYFRLSIPNFLSWAVSGSFSKQSSQSSLLLGEKKQLLHQICEMSGLNAALAVTQPDAPPETSIKDLDVILDQRLATKIVKALRKFSSEELNALLNVLKEVQTNRAISEESSLSKADLLKRLAVDPAYARNTLQMGGKIPNTVLYAALMASRSDKKCVEHARLLLGDSAAVKATAARALTSQELDNPALDTLVAIAQSKETAVHLLLAMQTQSQDPKLQSLLTKYKDQPLLLMKCAEAVMLVDYALNRKMLINDKEQLMRVLLKGEGEESPELIKNFEHYVFTFLDLRTEGGFTRPLLQLPDKKETACLEAQALLGISIAKLSDQGKTMSLMHEICKRYAVLNTQIIEEGLGRLTFKAYGNEPLPFDLGLEARSVPVAQTNTFESGISFQLADTFPGNLAFYIAEPTGETTTLTFPLPSWIRSKEQLFFFTDVLKNIKSYSKNDKAVQELVSQLKITVPDNVVKEIETWRDDIEIKLQEAIQEVQHPTLSPSPTSQEALFAQATSTMGRLYLMPGKNLCLTSTPPPDKLAKYVTIDSKKLITIKRDLRNKNKCTTDLWDSKGKSVQVHSTLETHSEGSPLSYFLKLTTTYEGVTQTNYFKIPMEGSTFQQSDTESASEAFFKSDLIERHYLLMQQKLLAGHAG